MIIKFPAYITFLSHDEGGKKHPPPSNTDYSCQLQLNNSLINWSIVLNFVHAENERSGLGHVWFLMPDAPHEILSLYSEFGLAEGPHKVGSFKIIK